MVWTMSIILGLSENHGALVNLMPGYGLVGVHVTSSFSKIKNYQSWSFSFIDIIKGL